MNSDDPMSMAMAGMSFLRDSIRTGQQIGENRYQADERDGVNKAYEYFAGKLGDTGDISQLDGDPMLNTRHGTMALGQFMQQRLNNQTSRLGFLQKRAAADTELYENTLRPMMIAATEAYKSGDVNQFGQIAGELSRKFPAPYRYTLGEDGMFKEEFRSDKHDGWVDTKGRATPQQAFEQLQGLMRGEQQILVGANMRTQTVNPVVLAMSARSAMGTISGNAQNLADDKQWIPLTKNGHTVYAIRQNRIDKDGYSKDIDYKIIDERAGTAVMVESLNDLLSQGYVRADVKADTQNKQRIAAGKGVGGGSGGAVNAKIGPKSGDVHRAMLAAGHAWVPEQGWYYAVTIDEEGKARADLSKPAKQEMYNAILSRNKAGGASNSNDPMGILAALQSNLKTHSAQSNIPTPAPATTQQQPAQGNNTEPPVPHPSWNDLTREEQAHWEKTGRLPAKFGQVR